jgi:pseudoazurin|tara:strand:+ start:1206 stop:1649 length:444 start_codon:yes stop_codon:yes gene_type:complete
MKLYLILLVACFMGGMVLSAKAEEKEPLVIEMLNKRGKDKMLYGQDVARVEVGQTITWTPKSKGHNVQFVSVPEGVEKVKSKLSKEFSYTFEQEGVYLYVCTPHASMGMIGMVVVGESDVNLDEVLDYKFRGKSKKKFKKIVKSLEG